MANDEELRNAFLEKELSVMMTEVFEKQYREMQHRTLIPVRIEGPSWINRIEWKEYDQMGMAIILSSLSDKLPRIDINVKSKYADVYTIGDAIGYTQDQVNAAMNTGLSLKENKLQKAYQAALYLENKIAFQGDKTRNIPGLFSHPNIMRCYRLGDTSKTILQKIQSKDHDGALADLHYCSNQIPNITSERRAPNTMLMPPDLYRALKNYIYRAEGTLGTQSLLDTFLGTEQYIKDVFPLKECEKAGLGVDTLNKDIICVYERDPSVLHLRIVLEFEPQPPKLEGFEYIINCKHKFAGCIITEPFGVGVIEGI